MAGRRTVEFVLQEIGLHGLLENFNSQRVEFSSLLNLTDNELSRLGVTTIGDRVRLREKVREIDQAFQGQLQDDTDTVTQRNRCVGGIAGRERHMLFRSGRSSRKRANAEGKHRPWTVTSVCLSDKNCSKVPTADVKETLLKAGLGCKKIQFNSDDNLMEKICSNEKDENNEYIGFPQLKDCGGFELLRCQANSRSLTVIDCPWTVKSLKKFLGTQAKIYIRPIQRNLCTEPLTVETVDAEVTEACINCGQMIPVKNLRSHCQESCQGTQLQIDNTVETTITGAEMTVTTVTVDTAPAANLVYETDSIVYVTSDVTNREVVTQAGENNLQPQLDLQSANADMAVNHLDDNNDSALDLQSANVETVVQHAIEHLISHNIDNPVEMLRYLQSVLVTGRKLDIDTTDDIITGETNFINIDRHNILETAFDEIKVITNPRLTLEVQFYDEMAVDYGGPRKEFFRLVLGAIKEKYFDNGLREHLKEDYITIGRLFSLSILQNGKIPAFINDLEDQIFSMAETNSESIRNLQIGLDWLGLYTVGVTLPMFRYIFRPTTPILTVRLLTHLLRPTFSDAGSNRRTHESKVYAAFTRYMREAAGGRRGPVTLRHILKFATGAEEEPVLGFSLHPTIQFSEVSTSFVPTANTCANTMYLPRPTSDTPLPLDETLFYFYDLAFSNTYFERFAKTKFCKDMLVYLNTKDDCDVGHSAGGQGYHYCIQKTVIFAKAVPRPAYLDGNGTMDENVTRIMSDLNKLTTADSL